MNARIITAPADKVTPAQFMEMLFGPYDRQEIYEGCIRAILRGDTYGWPPMMVEHCNKLIAERESILDLEATRNDDGTWSVAA